MGEPIPKDFPAVSDQASVSTCSEANIHLPVSAVMKAITPEAALRIKGYEGLIQRVCMLAQEEARTCGVPLLHIDIRPAWSHEYDERTGVAVEVEVQVSPEMRFSYWDAVGERLNELESSLPSEERRFLNDELSLVITRS